MSLMAFILMLILGLSTITQLELATASTTQQKDAARENARLGLLVALGRLQSTAGPDQRVTARAEILGDGNYDPSNRYWTGVWNTTNMQADPVWLVSGQFNIEAPVNPNNSALLAGSAYFGPLPDRYIRTPKEPIAPSSFGSSGNFAYWISDEGLKASLGKNSNLERFEVGDLYKNLGLSDPLQLKRLRQISGDRPYWERLFRQVKDIAAKESYKKDNWENQTKSLEKNATSFEQLTLIPVINQPTQSQPNTSELQYYRPDITLLSRGVLANAKDGGLKLDLSNDNLTDPNAPFEINSEFRSFLNTRPDSNDRATFRGASAVYSGSETVLQDIGSGDPVNTVGPILVEFGLYLGVFRESTSASNTNLRFCIRVRADIWNPLATQMAFSPRNIDDLIFDIDIPDITVTWVTSKDSNKEETGSFIFAPKNLNFENPDRNKFSLNEVPFDIFDKMNVGEVRTVYEEARARIPFQFEDRNGSGQDLIALYANASTVTVRLKTPSGKLIQEFKDIPFESLDTLDERTLSLRQEDWPSYSDYQALYHFKYNDEMYLGPNAKGDMEKWMSEIDPRQPVMNFSSDDANMFFINEFPAASVTDQTVFMGRPEFFYGGNYHRFFDYATTEPISVGFLQHLQLNKGKPFAIGNTWGDSLNSAFDRYFFSSLTDSHGYDEDYIPNHHLSKIAHGPLDPAEGDEAAGAFLVDGAFNVNSTSQKAWEAALGSIHLYDWKYRVNDDASPITLKHVENAVFRFSHTADRSYTHPYSNGSARITNYPEATQSQRERWYRQHWQPDWAAAFTVGARQLRDGDNSEGIDDVADLAAQIVAKLKLRGKPYESFEAMLNDGLIQEAIDDTRINTVSNRIYSEESSFLKKFPRYCPSFVTQADIINVLAPYAQVRSDTFIIRSYGESVDPLTGEINGKAWCEALVQRLPTPHGEPVVAEYLNPSDPMGRKFEIIEFRWLNENEI